MITFYDKCYDVICKNEGGYNNDPKDSGGETYCGVARRYNKTWDGWKVIDRYRIICEHDNINPKNNPKEFKNRMNLLLKNNSEIDYKIRKLYSEEYWQPCKCDGIGEVDKKLALYVFDYAINSGVSRAVKDLQAVLNVVVDGKIGEKTLEALQVAHLHEVQSEATGKGGLAPEDQGAERMHSIKNEYIAKRRLMIENSNKIAPKFKKGLYNRLKHLQGIEV